MELKQTMEQVYKRLHEEVGGMTEKKAQFLVQLIEDQSKGKVTKVDMHFGNRTAELHILGVKEEYNPITTDIINNIMGYLSIKDWSINIIPKLIGRVKV